MLVPHVLLALSNTSQVQLKVQPLVGKVQPLVGHEPLTVNGSITVEPHPSNTVLCLIWDSDYGTAGSSCWQLDKYSLKVRKFQLKDLPYGNYSMVARLWRDQDQIINSPVRKIFVSAGG